MIGFFNMVREINQLQNNIELNEPDHKAKSRKKKKNFSKYSLPIVSSGNIRKRNLSLKDANEEQSKLSNELKGVDKGVK